MGYTTGEHHNLCHHPLYRIWGAMKRRCNNKRSVQYKWYGGKGIRVCDKWSNSFKTFFDWATDNGWNKNMSIERIDISKGYSPENCKIIPIKQQARNRKSTLWVEYNGEKMSLAECVEKFSKISYKVVWQRIFINGYSLDDALKKPKGNAKWQKRE